MSKAGDTTTTNSSSTLPAYLQNYVPDLLAKAKTVTSQPYVPYQGQRLANFSADTQGAFQDIRNQDASGGGIGAVNTGIGAASNLAGFHANSFAGADLTPYTDPYYRNVVDFQKQQANQDYQEQQAGRDASAVNAGAFGGDRRFVADSLAQRGLNQQLQGIEATGAENAYNSATNLWQQDQTNRLQAGNLGLNAASTLGQLGQTKNDLGLQNAEALSGVGSKIQQQQQAGLDVAHQNFMDQQNWPAQQLQLYASLLNGSQPKAPDTSTATTAPAPDFLSQLTGLTTAGVGLAQLLGIGA